MNFEKTKEHIAAAPENGYTAQHLLSMLEDLARDVYEEAQVQKLTQLPVGDRRKLIVSMHSLSGMLLDAYVRGQDALAEFADGEFRDEIRQRAEELRMAEAQLAKLAPQILAEEEKADRLKRTLKQTQQRKKYLVSAQAECVRLQEQIQQLNDATMDTLMAQKAALETELAQRREQEDALKQQIAPLREEHCVLESSVRTLTEEVEQLQTALDTLAERERELAARKAQLEEGTVGMQARVEAAEESLDNVPEDYLRVQKLYEEIAARLTVMRNAVNSARTDAFLAATLFSAAGSGAELTVENYPDLSIAGQQLNSWEELEDWFRCLEQRILGQLTVVRQMLEKMVEAAQAATARNE